MKISTTKKTIYINSKNNPSFLVIFRPDLINMRAKIDPTIRNILAIKNGEKSLILNGNNKPIIPSTNVALTMTDPIRSPNISQLSSFLAEIIEKYSSGKQLPKPTIKIPTNDSEMPRV